MDGKKNQALDSDLLTSIPAVEVESPEVASRPARQLSTGWAAALSLAPLLLFVAIGEFAPEPAGDPATETLTTTGLVIGVAMLLAMGATAGLALVHRISAAVPAIGLASFGIYGQVDCAMQSHAATGTVGFWAITAAFALLGLAGLGGATNAFRASA